jgi:hypothetical protein
MAWEVPPELLRRLEAESAAKTPEKPVIPQQDQGIQQKTVPNVQEKPHETQEIPPKPQPNTQNQASSDQTRLPNGQFAPGHSGNPSGENGLPSCWQPFRLRAAHLLKKYTVAQIKRMAQGKDPEFENLSSYDAGIITRIANSLTAKGGRDFYKMIEFIDGKAIEAGKPLGTTTDPIYSKTELVMNFDPAHYSKPQKG